MNLNTKILTSVYQKASLLKLKTNKQLRKIFNYIYKGLISLIYK